MKKWIISLMVLCILATTGYIGYQNLSYENTPQGEETEIFEGHVTETSGYEYDEERKSFIEIGIDPHFILTGMEGQMIGGLKIVLKDASYEDIPVQVFYTTDASKGFSERHSSRSVLPAQGHECYVKIPMGSYESFRIDMDSSFIIKQIYALDEEMISKAYISQQTVSKTLKYFPVIGIGFLLLFYAHYDKCKGRSLKDYGKTILFGEPSHGKREIHLDYMRAGAAVIIILSHSISNELEASAEGSALRLFFIALLTFGVCTNVVYVMLSGKLLLSGKIRDEKVSEFYCKRAAKVIIPMVAYYVFLMYLNHEITFFPPQNLELAVRKVLIGAPDVAPHFWLIYTIVALYIATPFFKVCVQHLSEKMLVSLSIVIMVMNALTTYLPLFNIPFGVTSFLAGWEGVFLLGYILNHDMTRKYDNKLMVAGLCSYVLSTIVMFRDYDMINYIYVCAPTTVLTTCGIFAFFIKKQKWFSKDNLLLRLCSKYSFSILMIHWYTLFVITEGRYHMSIMRGHVIGGMIATTVIAYGIAMLFVVVFDNSVVLILNMLFDKIVGIFTGIGRKRET